MSTVKFSNMIVGRNATDTNNFRIDTDGAGALRIRRGATGSGGAVMTLGSGAGWPAFSVTQNAGQSIPSGAQTKIQFPVEEFDTAGAFDSATNYRFTPQVAGYYQVNGAFLTSATPTSGNAFFCTIWKNGAEFKRGTQINPNGTLNPLSTVSALIYMNGSTDYIELYAFQNTVGAINTSGGLHTTYFQAYLVRNA